ncbi:hypothetical protein [Streptomyces afghaniensis]|uniref:hypothetical protein n=1 Tax=Streptomyces afghaniensis TaxID=66865 RepID=UPI002781FB4B|nr:hypothetical protein [Streptomyces afghaniensis]MDQ1018957.1 hypothetical protein [Streptomyces afghaniensis]
MSGCCGQGPVIVSGATATPRVDVEAVLLCDVLPDGSVAATVLVEPVYDTVSGDRVGTRIVDPATGATYAPAGTLGPCAADGCARQVVQSTRCDDADGDGTGEITYVELWAVDPCNGGAPELIGTYQDGDLAQPYTPVAPVDCPAPVACPTCTEQVLCDTQPVTSAIGAMPPNPINGYTLPNGVTWRATSPDTLLFANDRWRADAAPAVFTFSEPVLMDWAVAYSGAGTTTVYVPPGNDVVSVAAGHSWNPTTRQLSATASTTAAEATTFRARDVSSWTAPSLVGGLGGAFAYYGDISLTVDVAHPFLRTTCRDCSGALVSTADTELDGATAYTPSGTVDVCAPVAADRQRWDGEVIELCDTAPDGSVTPFLRHLRYGTLDGIVYGRRDTTLDGVTAYTPAGTVGRCPTLTDCSSPTTPVATVGLCLADGTPIAVTVQRDCDGVVTSQGWVNLTTGAYSAGQPPAGTGACGDSQSVQVSGTFCDVDPATGDVLGLVLVEYSYAADGTIDSVRLVDAVTGATYTPTGTVTVCPAGVEQPDQDVIQLCDVAADGTSVPFIRDLRRDETGTVTGFSDYDLSGAAYTPTGTVGLCSTPQPERDLTVLCDTYPDGSVVEFVRDYERDAAGAITGHSDYSLDGAAYTSSTGGTVGQCQPPACELTPICVRPSGRVEFLSNPAGDTSGVDADWTWGQSLAGPWFPTYRVGMYPGWTTVDPGTAEGTAQWIAPHPDSQLANTGQPGEGPAITAATPDWYGRATFQLPSFADPATIRISATALNADQLAVEWRLNGGAWQTVNSSHAQPPYTLAPTAVPGAQAGLNEIVVHVRETVFPTGAAGILLHVIAEYDVDASAYLQWTQVVCTDGEMYYLDDLGVRQDAIPDGATVVPCPGATESCAKAVVERCGCDDTDGDGLGDVTYTELWAVDPCGGADPELLGTYLDGDLTQPYTPVAPVECTAAEALPGPLSTGVRAVTGTAPQNLAGSFAGLQSVSLTVLASTVNVTMNDGAAVPVPAGVTMTWSVAQDSDTALAAASFAGAVAGASYLLNWTWK